MIKYSLHFLFVFCLHFSLFSQNDFIDNFNDWKFEYYPLENNNAEASPIGVINFKRVNGLEISEKLIYNNKFWFPNIEYSIYELKDSISCKRTSLIVQHKSSCVPPNIGGDYFVKGNFIFLNQHACLDCQSPSSDIDFCRPIIKSIFDSIKTNPETQLQDILNQIPLKEIKL